MSLIARALRTPTGSPWDREEAVEVEYTPTRISVDLPNDDGTVLAESTRMDDVWLRWGDSSGRRMCAFIPVAKAREIARALWAAADATTSDDAGSDE